VTKENGELFSVAQEMRAASTVFGFSGRDENVQVNGFVFVLDLSGVGPKHMTRWNMEDMRKWHACWQVLRSVSQSVSQLFSSALQHNYA